LVYFIIYNYYILLSLSLIPLKINKVQTITINNSEKTYVFTIIVIILIRII
jgi:hypothetical protein